MSKLIKGAFFLSGSPPGFTARSASWLFVLLLLAALPVAKTAIGAEQTGPGQEELQAQDEQQEQARLSRELGVRQLAIEELQFERGIYDPALMEAYSDLGGLYTELEDYASAAQLYADALQLTRINTGLYSEQQLPLIKSLIETNTRLKDWDKVDGLQHLNLHISSRLWGIGDAEYLLVAQDYGDWKLRLVRENLLQLNSRGLLGIAEDLSRLCSRWILSKRLTPTICCTFCSVSPRPT
jgi:tetratricopeptide (TPR) repeat protein